VCFILEDKLAECFVSQPCAVWSQKQALYAAELELKRKNSHDFALLMMSGN